MTAFDLAVPLLGFVVAAVGIAWLRREGRKLDRETVHHAGE